MVTTTPTRRAVRRDADISGRAVFAIVNYSVFLALAFVCAYPFYYLIINSISSNDLAALGEVRWLPSGIHFANYEQVFQLGGLTQAAIVSVGRTVLGTVAAVCEAVLHGWSGVALTPYRKLELGFDWPRVSAWAARVLDRAGRGGYQTTTQERQGRSRPPKTVPGERRPRVTRTAGRQSSSSSSSA